MKETEGESCFDIIKNILVDKFGWDGAPQIERAHRDGLRKNGRSAHILVKMLSYQDTVRVLKARRTAMEGSPLYVLEDLTARDRMEKIKWKTEVKALYDRGTKLRFFAGRWRSGNGVPFDFGTAKKR